MVAFGGAGPAHAARGGARAGRRRGDRPAGLRGGLRARLPRRAALLRAGRAALPMLARRGLDSAQANAHLAELEAAGRSRLAAAGVADADIDVERTAEMRLVGQLHQIMVRLPDGALAAESLPALIREAFEAAYTAALHPRRTTAPRSRSCRSACGSAARRRSSSLAGAVAGARPARRSRAPRRPGSAGGFHDTPVYDRYALAPGETDRRPGDHRGARGHDGRRARRQPDGGRRRATCASPSPPPQHAQAIVTPGMSLEQAKRAHRGRSDRARDHVGRLVNVVEEMWQTVCRTAYSLIISESQDFACEILDPQGRPLAHSPARHAAVQPHAAARRARRCSSVSRPRRCRRATCW